MKNLFLILFIFLCPFTYTSVFADVYVKGHYRNGKYVKGYYRSDPDSTKRNNFSHCGNVNPYTGKIGTKDCGSSYNIFPKNSSSSRKTIPSFRPLPKTYNNTYTPTPSYNLNEKKMIIIPEYYQKDGTYIKEKNVIIPSIYDFCGLTENNGIREPYFCIR